jgi:hypothetical protein
MLLRWGDWVHRRVETVYFEGAGTYRRHLSIDFTVEHDLEALVESGDGLPLHLTPLTLLRKRPLTNFDFRDESDRAVPLLTKKRNGALAAALLSGLATVVTSDELQERHGEQPPVDVEEALIRIAYSDGTSMDPVDDLFNVSLGDTPASREWRTELRNQLNFRAFAQALNESYLVVVPLVGPAGVRRVLKLAYDEPPALETEDGEGGRVSRLARRALSVVYGERFGSRPPLPNPGGWEKAGWRRLLELRRIFGIRAHLHVIRVPAASYGSSYHVEFVAPPGLIVTRATLISFRPGDAEPQLDQLLVQSRERAPLYLDGGVEGPPFVTEAAAMAHLRPTASTLIRATTLLSIFTTALLLFVAFRWEALVGNAAGVPSLLLIVPAGLAAFIARPGEASVTTGLLLGIRSAAVAVGVCAFAAAALLVGGRSCEPGLFYSTCSSWPITPILLFGLAALSAVVMLLLSVAWHFSNRPPEQTVGK